MANENVGSIEYTIDANTDPLLRANKSATTSLTKVETSLDKTGTASTKLDAKLKILSSRIGSITNTMKRGATAAVGVTASLTAISKVAASAGLEIQKMAQLSNVGVERFQELAYGASQLGVSGEKLGDIFKDVQDKMGDFINTGGGELADYFNNIAPLVKQTADQFKDLSGPDALIKFKEGLDAANISAAEQTFFLESLANDVTILAPLLKNGAKGFEDAAKEARELNLVLSEAEVQELVDVNKEFNALLSTIAKVTQKIVAENGPQIREAIQQMTDLFISAAEYADKFFKTMGGGSEIAQLETKASSLVMKLESLQEMTKKQFALKVGSDATSELLDAFLAAEKLSEEYGKLQNDSRLNVDVKAARLESVGQRLLALNGKIEELRAEVDDEFNVYVKAETDKAQQELMLVNGEIANLQEAAKEPIVIEVKTGQKQTSVATGASIFDSPGFREGQTFEVEDTYQLSSSGETKGDSASSQMALDMQEALGVSQEMASELEMLDSKFQDIGTTINDTLVGAALTFGDTIGDAVANGIAEGESFNEVMNNIGKTIATQVLSSLVSLGVQYGINAALKSTADASMAASGVTAMAATAAAGIASANALSAAWAPAAAGASTATAGAAAKAGAAGLTTTYGLASTLSLAGGRLNGGAVTAGNAYEVTENGKPEMLTVGGKDILMMGNQSGTVTSNSDLTSGGTGGGVIVNVNNNASGATATATSSTSDGKTIIEVVVADIRKNGQITRAITGNTTANYKPS